MKYLSIIFIFLTQVSFAIQPDYAKEERLFMQIEDSLMDGEIVGIKGADAPFISIFTEAEEPSKKVAIVMHGLGAHPNWETVIKPLRISLTKQGYNTLSIQLPVLANEIDAAEYMNLLSISDKRIQASIKYLQQQGYIVDLIVAHSFGSTMATHFLVNNDNDIKSFIGVGMPASTIQYLSKMNMYILDLYGSDDIMTVLSSASMRAKAASKNNKYIQIIEDTDHFFTNNDDVLINIVNQWIN